MGTPEEARTTEVNSDQSKGGQSEGSEGVKLTNLEEIKKKHPELEAYAKQLLADYTRKTQEIAKVRNKAKAFEEITNDPAFKSFAQKQYGLGATGSQPQDNDEESDIPKVEIDEDLADEDLKKVVKHYESTINKLNKKISNLEQDSIKRSNEQMVADMKKQYPDFEEKLPEILPLMRQGFSPEAAYLKKYGDDIVEQKVKSKLQKLQEEKEQDEVDTTLPNTGTGKETEPVGDIDNLSDAIDLAKKEISSKQ